MRGESSIQSVLDTFRWACGITIEGLYGVTAAMGAQLQEEGSRTPADVCLAQDAGALGAVAGGICSRICRTRCYAPTGTRALERVGMIGRSRTMVHNVDQVPEEDLPQSVFDLTTPEWKGKVGAAPTSRSFQAFITAMHVEHGDERTQVFLDAARRAEVARGRTPGLCRPCRSARNCGRWHPAPR